LNKNIVKNKNHYNPWLDLFRALAALLVCVGHIRNAFWVNYGEIQIKAWWHVPVYLLTGFGHQAVIVFFVLSGFLVGGGVLARGKNFSWIDYLLARLVRLWLVLIPALLFTTVCDLLTLHAQPNAFNGVLRSLWNSGPSSLEGFGWKVFIANGLFLQTIVVPVFGSNGPLWSLANEFWYYMLFPLFICSLSPVGAFNFYKRGIFLLLAIGIALWLPIEIISYYSIWLMGAICFFMIKRYPLRINRFFTIVSGVIFVAALAATKILPKDQLPIWSDLVLGLLFSILLICINAHKVPWKSHGLLGVVIKKMSDFSYSLYLFHFPLVILLAVTMIGTAQLQPNVAAVIALFGATSLCLAVAWISWFLFERKNNCIRDKVRPLIARILIFRIRSIGNWGSN
jgi:peptidoglycan/LPS O-acetylase OafA/YrhL